MKPSKFSEFSIRHLVAFAFVLLVVGLLSAHFVKNVFFNENSPEVQARDFNSKVEETLCSRIRDDLVNFKKSPLNFARSDLETLIAEATEISKTTNRSSIGDFVYTGRKIDYLGRCAESAKQWVKIRSLASNFLDNDYSYFPPGVFPSGAIAEGIEGVTHEKRVVLGGKVSARALVIGNSEYRDRPLRNPVNDADVISKHLKDSGFVVDVLLNATAVELREATEKFVKEIPNHQVNLLFYSGHGTEISGRNYLIPSDAEIRKIGELARQATDLTKLVSSAEKYPDVVSIFLIDACRTLPILSDSRAVSGGMSSISLKDARGIVVGYSTSPGSLALDGNDFLSPYTTALVRQLRNMDQDIEQILKGVTVEVRRATNGRQVPWYASSLVGRVSLNLNLRSFSEATDVPD